MPNRHFGVSTQSYLHVGHADFAIPESQKTRRLSHQRFFSRFLWKWLIELPEEVAGFLDVISPGGVAERWSDEPFLAVAFSDLGKLLAAGSARGCGALPTAEWLRCN